MPIIFRFHEDRVVSSENFLPPLSVLQQPDFQIAEEMRQGYFKFLRSLINPNDLQCDENMEESSDSDSDATTITEIIDLTGEDD